MCEHILASQAFELEHEQRWEDFRAWEELGAAILFVPQVWLCVAHPQNLWPTLLEPRCYFFLLPGLFGLDLTNYEVALQSNPWVTNRKG